MLYRAFRHLAGPDGLGGLDGRAPNHPGFQLHWCWHPAAALRRTRRRLSRSLKDSSHRHCPGHHRVVRRPNPSTGQGTAQPGATTDQAPASTPPASDWLKEVQAGITAVSPGRFENTKYKWYGFVRLDSIYDFNPIGSTDDFVTSSIPVPQGRGQNYVLTPRYTRIGFDTSTPMKDMDWTIKTKIELDFFNGNTSGLFGRSRFGCGLRGSTSGRSGSARRRRCSWITTSSRTCWITRAPRAWS